MGMGGGFGPSGGTTGVGSSSTQSNAPTGGKGGGVATPTFAQNPYATTQPRQPQQRPMGQDVFGYNLNRLARQIDPSASLPSQSRPMRAPQMQEPSYQPSPDPYSAYGGKGGGMGGGFSPYGGMGGGFYSPYGGGFAQPPQFFGGGYNPYALEPQPFPGAFQPAPASEPAPAAQPEPAPAPAPAPAAQPATRSRSGILGARGERLRSNLQERIASAQGTMAEERRIQRPPQTTTQATPQTVATQQAQEVYEEPVSQPQEEEVYDEAGYEELPADLEPIEPYTTSPSDPFSRGYDPVADRQAQEERTAADLAARMERQVEDTGETLYDLPESYEEFGVGVTPEEREERERLAAEEAANRPPTTPSGYQFGTYTPFNPEDLVGFNKNQINTLFKQQMSVADKDLAEAKKMQKAAKTPQEIRAANTALQEATTRRNQISNDMKAAVKRVGKTGYQLPAAARGGIIHKGMTSNLKKQLKIK